MKKRQLKSEAVAKRIKAIEKTREIMKLASDDWHPCYEGNQVSLTLRPIWDSNTSATPVCWRVSIWGADDFGMDVDLDFDRAKRLYEKLAAMTFLSQKIATDHGLKPF